MVGAAKDGRRGGELLKRRWIHVLAGVGIGIVVVVGGLVITLRLTSPPPLGDTSAAEARALPKSWLEAQGPDYSTSQTKQAQTDSAVAADLAPASESPIPRIQAWSRR